MKIIADTNILARFIVRDDETQFNAACQLLAEQGIAAVVPA